MLPRTFLFLSFLTSLTPNATAFQSPPTPIHHAVASSPTVGRKSALSNHPPTSARQYRRRRQPLHMAVEIPLAASVAAVMKASPYAAAAVVCGVKASAADAVAQFKESSSDAALLGSDRSVEPNWKRNLAFLLYGAFYQGMTQEYLMNTLYPMWFGAGTGIVTVLCKVAFTLIIQTTLLTLPSLYVIKAALERRSPRTALRRYWHDICHQALLHKFYVLWGPVSCLTYSVVPAHLRVSFVATISFFWLIALSAISNKASKKG